ncbi:MAG: SAM-dependent methyltransferase [Elusimicrobia bacterium]|nr:SAM-dependent methyltransferase [Elusimicrobiota bacterium]
MSSLDEIVRAEVRRRGRVTFAEFMGWALTHPTHGYYMTKIRTGRGGDFVTNVQAGPLFGRLLAESFVEMWDALGSEKFTLVELGGSDGSLAESVLRALEEMGRDRRVTLHVVEASPVARQAARRRLSRYGRVQLHACLEEMEHTAGVEGCVYSNEFFDALPFHRVRWKEGRLWELWVEEAGGKLFERPGPLSPGVAEAFNGSGVTLGGRPGSGGLSGDGGRGGGSFPGSLSGFCFHRRLWGSGPGTGGGPSAPRDPANLRPPRRGGRCLFRNRRAGHHRPRGFHPAGAVGASAGADPLGLRPAGGLFSSGRGAGVADRRRGSGRGRAAPGGEADSTVGPSARFRRRFPGFDPGQKCGGRHAVRLTGEPGSTSLFRKRENGTF